jgi:hypothetical protein
MIKNQTFKFLDMKKLIFYFCLLLISLSASAQLPSYVPTSGLVGYWPFNGNANDVSGNGNNGTVTGAVMTKNRYGINNQAYLFSNLITSSITLPHSTQQNVFSVMAWVKPLRAIDMKNVSTVCPISVSVTMANSNQNWLIVPSQQPNPNIGSGGLSVGTNGVMSSEHGINILVPRHSFSKIDTNFICVVLVYKADSTFLYVNGVRVESRPIHCNSAIKKMAGPSTLGGRIWNMEQSINS